MSKIEWFDSTDSVLMLAFLRGMASDRKLRLFACACCRRIWHLMKFDASRQAIEVAEQFADGLATEAERDATGRSANLAKTAGLGGTTTFPASRAAYACTHRKSAVAAVEASRYAVTAGNQKRERRAQPSLLREIFGNPFRSNATDPSWLTSTVVLLAQGIYEERAYDRLPILADALQDAGCDDSDILDHCRQPSEHVRGCWVVDMLLAKD